MARKRKLTPKEAKAILVADGVDFSKDFHALSSDHLAWIADIAKLAGYRKSQNASGSTARMYFYYLQRS